MEKKPYNPPTLTDHGSVVELTKGIVGWTYESHGVQYDGGDVGKPPKS